MNCLSVCSRTQPDHNDPALNNKVIDRDPVIFKVSTFIFRNVYLSSIGDGIKVRDRYCIYIGK